MVQLVIILQFPSIRDPAKLCYSLNYEANTLLVTLYLIFCYLWTLEDNCDHIQNTGLNTMVQLHAPAHVAEMPDKESFYNQLNALVDKISKGDIEILVSYLNVMIDSDNSDYDRAMGRGERILECEINLRMQI